MSADEVAQLDPTFGKAVDAWLTWLRANGTPQVYILSGLRTADEQMALRRQNCPDPINSPSGDCDPPTAQVGQSQHQRGLAVDIAPASAYSAAGAAAGRFNLRATVAGEPWHFELADATGVQGVVGGGVVDVVGGGLDVIGGTLVGGGIAQAQAIAGALGRLVQPGWWLRVGIGTAGVLIVAAGGLAVLDQTARGALQEAL